MRKLTALLLLSAFMCIQAFANPAIRGLVQMPQPDGTLVSIRLVGDEFYSFNTTADDYTVVLNENGAYVYVQREGTSLVPTTVLAHDEGQRDATELALLSTLNKRMTDRVSVEQANIRRVKRNVDLSNFDFENFRGLVILIDFSDKHFEAEDPQAFYTEMFSTEGLTGWRDPHTDRDVTCPGSVRDYFNDQSDGAFNPPFDVYGPYTTSYKASQCSNNSGTIFRNVLRTANDDIDFKKYDNNNDGKVDMVFFLVAGYSAAANGRETGYTSTMTASGWTVTPAQPSCTAGKAVRRRSLSRVSAPCATSSATCWVCPTSMTPTTMRVAARVITPAVGT